MKKKELEYEYYVVGEIEGQTIYKRVLKTVPIEVELKPDNSTLYKQEPINEIPSNNL